MTMKKEKGKLPKAKSFSKNAKAHVEQFMISDASSDAGSIPIGSSSPNGTHRNLAATIVRADKYKNIREGIFPFRRLNSSTTGRQTTTLDIREVIELCQLCYYNFALFRNTIDTMTE